MDDKLDSERMSVVWSIDTGGQKRAVNWPGWHVTTCEDALAMRYRMQLASDRRRLTAATTPAERRRAARWLAFAADTAALYLQLRDQYRTTEAIEAEADETARLHAALGYCWCGEQPCPMPSQHAATAQTCHAINQGAHA